MISIYVVAALFMGWLAVMLYRVCRVALACRGAGGGDGGPHRLAVLVQDQADSVEWFVHRLVVDLRRRPGLRVALVDGGSTDETGLILERQARRYNLEFRQLSGLGMAHGSASCLDLRGIPGGDLLKFDLSVVDIVT